MKQNIAEKQRFLNIIRLAVMLLLVTGVVACTDKQQGGSIDGHEYVDLGLPSGNLWATCNLGATKCYQYGSYYKWGEIQPSDSMHYVVYKWAAKDTTTNTWIVTKYCTKEDYGHVDHKYMLDATDDAAVATWGQRWKMPKLEDFVELHSVCTWEWIENYQNTGVSGALGTSIKNGNTIFFPAGSAFDAENENIVRPLQGDGNYWSAELKTVDAMAGYFYLGPKHTGSAACFRRACLNIRAVATNN